MEKWKKDIYTGQEKEQKKRQKWKDKGKKVIQTGVGREEKERTCEE